jgi:hypothetical protein
VRRRILDGRRHFWRATADGSDLDNRKRALPHHDCRLDNHHVHYRQRLQPERIDFELLRGRQRKQ